VGWVTEELTANELHSSFPKPKSENPLRPERLAVEIFSMNRFSKMAHLPVMILKSVLMPSRKQ
jgi:hypothetical protein